MYTIAVNDVRQGPYLVHISPKPVGRQARTTWLHGAVAYPAGPAAARLATPR